MPVDAVVGSDASNKIENFQDPLLIFNRFKEPSSGLRNFLAGRPTFLVCGGPSAREEDLSQLNQRGIWSLSVNNMAGFFHANAFICSDPPSKFHHGIWLDPSIMKFVPVQKMRRNHKLLRMKVGNEFKTLEYRGKPHDLQDCPNLWLFARRAWTELGDDFFTEESASWGNNNAGVKRTGNAKVLCTMLLAIRILYHLGSRKIYLVGADFHMTEEKGYAFGQDRTSAAVESNNAQYAVTNEYLCRMVSNGTFKKFGLELFNCYRNSGLRAFPHVPLPMAIEDVLTDFPRGKFDLDGWYGKKREGES